LLFFYINQKHKPTIPKKGISPVKRIFLFLATNIAVLVVIRVVLAVLGIHSTDQVGSLLVYSAVVGFAAAMMRPVGLGPMHEAYPGRGVGVGSGA